MTFRFISNNVNTMELYKFVQYSDIFVQNKNKYTVWHSYMKFYNTANKFLAI